MLTKTDLGFTEQLGSQMGRYVIMEALARGTGHEFVFFEEFLDRGVGARMLFDAFDIPNRVLTTRIRYARGAFQALPFVPKPSFERFRPDETSAFDERLLRLSDRVNYDIAGYFGLYHHWEKYKADLMPTFQFKEPVRRLAKNKIDDIRVKFPGRALVALHVRRTDYLQSSVHIKLSLRYYEDALARFPIAASCVVVFSDDVAWCKTQALFAAREVVFSEGNSNLVDMCMMSLCDHHIIANSSFSVWGALLSANPAKVVVCPKYFVRPGGSADWINGNYYPPDWVALDTESVPRVSAGYSHPRLLHAHQALSRVTPEWMKTLLPGGIKGKLWKTLHRRPD